MNGASVWAVHRARRAARRLALSTRAQLVVKTTIAAALAWVAGGLVGGDIERYRYYAPLGAVAMTYPTIARTVRQSWRAVAAIALGGGLGLAVHQTLGRSLPGLVVVVAVGVALAGLTFLRDQRSYVPIVALLVVVIGGSDPEAYAFAYLAMSLLGAVIGVAISVALPALRLSPGQRALRSVEELLADQLRDVADVLRSREPPDEEGWEQRMRSIRPLVDDMRRDVEEAADAQRGNPRARRRGYPANELRDVAGSLERAAALVEQVLELVSRSYRQGVESPFDSALADAAADALERIADLVSSYHRPIEADDEMVVAGRQALARIRDEFARHREMDVDDLAVVGAIVANLRRCLVTVEPAGAR